MKFRCLLTTFILTLVIVSSRSSGSMVTFEATPNVVHPVLTKQLELRCAVTDDKFHQSPIIVGRSITTTPLYPYSSPPSTTATTSAALSIIITAQPSVEISHITSIIISRHDPTTGNLETIASVSSFDPPTAEQDLEKISNVEGDTAISPVAGELGYLKVVWDYPFDEEVGIYSCEVSVLDLTLHPDSLTKSLEVSLSEPAVQDLVVYVADNDKYITQLQNVTAELLKSVSDVTNQMQQDSYAKDQIIQDLQNRIDDLENRTSGQNIQMGSHDSCFSSHNIVFPIAYSRPPKIFLSVVYYNHYHGSYGSSYYSSYDVQAQSITETGFTLVCSIYSTSNNIRVEWLSIDEA